jgi:hypothetical protein
VCGKGELNTGYWWGTLREGDHLEDPGLDGRKMLTWNIKHWDGVMDWIDLAQIRDRWPAVVNAEMNLRIP